MSPKKNTGMLTVKVMKTAYIYSLKIGSFAYGFTLALVMIANIFLGPSGWPFILFTSFLETLVLVFPFFICLLVIGWRKGLLPILLLATGAFHPFYTHQKFLNPALEDCPVSDCISVISVNLERSSDALSRFSQTHSEDADVFILLDLPLGVTSETLLEAFSIDEKLEVVISSNQDSELDSRLAVVSRKTLNGVELQRLKFPNPMSKDRDVIKFNHNNSTTEPLSFVVIHAPTPLSRSTMMARDAYFEKVIGDLSNQAGLIMIGDFNMTPWEQAFLKLPGKRAGDPRGLETWNAQKSGRDL